jgi:hypothetical protein
MATNTESFQFENLETGRFPSHQDWRTMILGQNLVRGTLLAKVTATGEYIQWDSNGGSGTEIPNAILSKDCDSRTAAAPCLIYTFGEFNQEALILQSGDTLTEANLNSLRDAGIYLVQGQVGN